MKKFFRNLMLFGIAIAMFTACGDEPEVTKKDASENQKEQKQNEHGTPIAIENGAIQAAFSVSDSKQVYFSQGNLQYQASTGTWKFADNQYDVIGYDNSNISSTYNGWIDLFSWGASGYNSIYPYSNDNYVYAFEGEEETDIASTNYDWGVYNKISNGGNQAGLWRTLTIDEWEYLIYDRYDYAQETSLSGRGFVNGVPGWILLPDGWETPSSIEFRADECNYLINVYSLDEWSVMQSYGAVFLPVAGYRDKTDIYDLLNGFYWSSSAFIAGDYSEYWEFRKNGAYGIMHKYRGYGLSVRLVQDVK